MSGEGNSQGKSRLHRARAFMLLVRRSGSVWNGAKSDSSLEHHSDGNGFSTLSLFHGGCRRKCVCERECGRVRVCVYCFLAFQKFSGFIFRFQMARERGFKSFFRVPCGGNFLTCEIIFLFARCYVERYYMRVRTIKCNNRACDSVEGIFLLEISVSLQLLY